MKGKVRLETKKQKGNITQEGMAHDEQGHLTLVWTGIVRPQATGERQEDQTSPAPLRSQPACVFCVHHISTVRGMCTITWKPQFPSDLFYI